MKAEINSFVPGDIPTHTNNGFVIHAVINFGL